MPLSDPKDLPVSSSVDVDNNENKEEELDTNNLNNNDNKEEKPATSDSNSNDAQKGESIY